MMSPLLLDRAVKLQLPFEYTMPHRLQEAVFISRPNRFLLRCRLLQQPGEIEAHLPDPGRLKELLIPGARLLIRKAESASRRTQWSVAMVYQGDTLVSINSSLPNQFMREAFTHGQVPGFEGCRLIKAEYTLGRHRYDFLLEKDGKPQIVEVKGVSLVEEGHALFPDAVTERGRSHVQHLGEMDPGEYDRHLVFIVQRSDASRFSPHARRDPAFASALLQALQRGLQIRIFSLDFRLPQIKFHSQLPFIPDRDL